MKRIILATLAVFATLCGSAQIIRSTTSEQTLVRQEVKEKSWNHSGLLVETGIGLLSGDADSDFAWEFGWGYCWHISSGFSWEVFKATFNVAPASFKETWDLGVTTGLRYDSPRIASLGDRSVFGNFSFGYGGTFLNELDDADVCAGLKYEVGVGVKMTRNLSLSLFYQGDNVSYEFYNHNDYTVDASWGMFGLKIEWQFR